MIQKDSILTFNLKHHSEKIEIKEDIEQEADSCRTEAPGLVPGFFFYESRLSLRVVNTQGPQITALFLNNVIFDGGLYGDNYEWTFYLFEVGDKYYFQRGLDLFPQFIENLVIE
jgi:hypothetical protein